ncbi:MAG TPA: aminotransferase class I/II-fold pyridoxal phosphate-dependent enzyme [Vicinamibacterales bacterium]|nr:aminotransferase class I/II-fold pyridoxal phosphate-dependent enzyme [Vicinamibacterales bacterium]
MSVSRRAFVRNLTIRRPTATAIAARGREAWAAEHWPDDQGPAAEDRPLAVRLSSNENPLGPSDACLQAIERAFVYSGRYPMNARPAMADLRALIARQNSLKPENVSLGAGSGEILDNAVRAFTSAERGLVSAVPTFEAPARLARRLNVPVNDISVDAAGRLDLEKMIGASKGAGLVFVCNPNNPTGAVHGAAATSDMVTRIRQASPDTVILIDEAYHEYVTDSSYSTAIPLVAQHPNVIISRTFSKAHGMAGLRLGYAIGQAEVISRMTRYTMPYNANALVVAAAVTSLEDEAHIARERARNTGARKFTTAFFQSAGFKTSDSQTNFIWVEIGRPAREFSDACDKHGIEVGRPFPPFEKTHARISIGTMEEMQRAVGVFRTVLGLTTTTAGRVGARS